MTNTEIVTKFNKTHEAFIQYIDSLSEAEFIYSHNNEKWNAGKQLNHIGMSLGALKKGMSMPKLALKMTFGTTKEPSKSYDEVVKKYTDRLKKPYTVEGSKFDPQPMAFVDKEAGIERFNSTMNKLVKAYQKFSDTDAEKYVLPHPLIGNLSMKEFMLFDIFHVQHHHKKAQEYLESFSET
jgi:Protein of unknown function (DUF1569).